jgi:hypothetical protein
LSVAAVEVEELFKDTTGNRANYEYQLQLEDSFNHLYHASPGDIRAYGAAPPRHHPDFPPEVMCAAAKAEALASGQGRAEKPLLPGGGL